MNRALSIVVVGSGLAGLLAAIRLARDGHSINVFERRTTLSNRGGGLMIRPNATRHLHDWGLQEKFETAAQISTTGVIRNLCSGDILDARAIKTYSQYPNWVMTRQDVQKILFEEAKSRHGITFHFGQEVVEICERPCAATLRDGSSLEADLVIVADGVRSHLREDVLSDSYPNLEPVMTGLATYQTNLPLEIVMESSQLGELVGSGNTTYVWRDQGRHVVSGCAKGSYIADFVVNESGQSIEIGKSGTLWDEVGDIDHVRRVYHDVAPPLQAWLKTVKTCSRWKLSSLPNLPRWTSEEGTLILLGDAAHAMLPSAAQGLSQIIEDVAALSYLLHPRTIQNSATTKDLTSIKSITSIWQDFRMPRVERIKALAGSTQSRYQSNEREKPVDSKLAQQSKPGEPPQDSREGSLGEQPTVGEGQEVQADMNAAFTSPAFLKWQYDYDLISELERYLRHS